MNPNKNFFPHIFNKSRKYLNNQICGFVEQIEDKNIFI